MRRSTTHPSQTARLWLWALGFVLILAAGGLAACTPTESTTSSTVNVKSTTAVAVRRFLPTQRLSPQSSQTPSPSLRMALISNIQKDAPAAYSLRTTHLTSFKLSQSVKVFHGVNSAQKLFATFLSDRIQLGSQPGVSNPWALELSLRAVGYQGQAIEVQSVQRQSVNNRLTYLHEGAHQLRLKEWYLNGPLGIEQGFSLSERPYRVGTQKAFLTLKMDVKGALLARTLPENQGVVFVSKDGQKRVYYRELHVKDAKGKILPSKMQGFGDHVMLLVDDSKAVYPIEIDPILNTQSKVLAGDGATNDNFSYYAVAIDSTGDRAVAGAIYENGSGSAYIFTRSGTTWTLQQKISASDKASGDRFGRAVAISGTTVVVGAIDDDDAGASSGSAYVFTFDGSVWSQQAKLVASDAAAGAKFGHGVSVVADTAIVGAPYHNSSAGAAYVFTRSGTTWTQQQKLTGAGGRFGEAVALSGESAAIGAPEDDGTGNPGGAVYVFTRSGTTWTQQQKLQPTNPGSAALAFGRSISLDGDDLLVGIPQSGTNFTGSAAVYTRSGTTWSLQQNLTGSDSLVQDFFGTGVSIKSGFLAVGSPGEGTSGAVYTYTRSGTTWSQTQKITASDTTSFIGFGRAVAMTADIIAVGSNGYSGANQTGALYIYQSTTGTGTCSSASNVVSPASPQSAGTSITFTTTANCSAGLLPEFQVWRKLSTGSYTMVRDWSSSNVYTWDTTGLATGTYHTQIWVRAIGSSATFEAATAVDVYSITGLPSTCTGVSGVANPLSPQPKNTAITITASTTCSNGGTPEYEFYIKEPNKPIAKVQPYSASNVLNWTPTLAGAHTIYIWTRAQGNTNSADSSTSIAYTINGTVCTSVNISTDLASPQNPGSNITVTGTGNCEAGTTPEYQFWTKSPSGSLTSVQAYSASNTYSWNPTEAGVWSLVVWVRAQGSSASSEATVGQSFTISGNACNSVTLGMSPAAPQTVGANVTLTGNATCQAGTAEYIFWKRNPNLTWTKICDWQASANCIWNTTGNAIGNYIIQVWSRAQGNTSTYEGVAIGNYTLQ